MVQKRKNLSATADEEALPQLKEARIGIVVSEWNREVTGAMLEGSLEVLKKCGVRKSNIITEWVPGSYELPLAAQFVIQFGNADAVICLGSVIQGETRHFEFICQSVAQNVAQVGIAHNVPVIFGVLTTDTMQQAIDRSGGKHGNKGVEAALAAVKMIALKEKLKQI
jgi:6,7-dimethyl-8-ribityllumazine synthase